MKELNQLENQLRSWIPRRPSASLESRLFSERRAELTLAQQGSGTAVPAFGPMPWQWLAPAMAMFVVGMTFFTRSSTVFTPFIASPPVSLIATVALTQPHLATYYASASHSEHNAWPVTTFEWTNGSRSLSTAPPVFRTNGLLP